MSTQNRRLWLIALCLNAGCEATASATDGGVAVNDAAVNADLGLAPLDGALFDGPPDATLPDATLPDATLPDATLPISAPFSFPIAVEDRDKMVPNLVFGFDHDDAPGQRINCVNYNGEGFPRCYDGHTGNDFVLAGQFQTMDAGSARVVAAAGGEVIGVEDGNYDRCHVSLETNDVTCDGHPMRANTVSIRHADGWVTRYLHLKKDSIPVVLGQNVTCGTVLGRVGSSGYSTFPHLHLEVVRPDGVSIDPYAGPESQAASYWLEQGDGETLPPTVCPTR